MKDASDEKMVLIADMTLQQIQDKIVEWADQALPNRTPQQAFLKLFEELGEVLSRPRDEMEWADVFIILVDLANFHGISGAMLNQAILDKMEVNRGRQWGENELGVMKHKQSIIETHIGKALPHIKPYHGEGMPSHDNTSA